MLDTIEDTVSMLYTVRMHGNNYKADVALEASAVTEIYQNLDDKVGAVIDHEAIAVRILTGYAKDKNDLEDDAIKKILIIASSIYAYYISLGNNADADQVNMSFSDIKGKRDTSVVSVCKSVLNITKEFNSAIVPYGLKEAKVAAATQALNSFNEFLASPLYERGISSAHRDMMVGMVEAAMGDVHLLDPIYESVKNELEEAYLTYRNSRVKYDYAGATTTPPLLNTAVPALSTMVILNRPFLATRRVILQNNDPDDSLLFGSSTVESSFTNNQRILGPGKTSAVLCGTLGPDGDYILVQNLSPYPIDIKLWVVE